MAVEVQVAIIAGIFSILVAMLSLLVPHLLKSRKVMLHIQDQVTNSHDTNLRDDITEAIVKLDRVISVQSQHTEDIRDVKGDVAWLSRNLYDLDQRIDKIA